MKNTLRKIIGIKRFLCTWSDKPVFWSDFNDLNWNFNQNFFFSFGAIYFCFESKAFDDFYSLPFSNFDFLSVVVGFSLSENFKSIFIFSYVSSRHSNYCDSSIIIRSFYEVLSIEFWIEILSNVFLKFIIFAQIANFMGSLVRRHSNDN